MTPPRIQPETPNGAGLSSQGDRAPPVLGVDGAGWAARRDDGERYDASVAPVSFELFPGDLLVVRLEWPNLHLPLADGLCGLCPPTRGRVRYMGHDWASASPRSASRLRGSIGRMLHAAGWMDDQSLAENITLARQYHAEADAPLGAWLRSLLTGRVGRRAAEAALWAQAEGLSRVFGLPGLPLMDPGAALDVDDRRSACVRAFLGATRLLVLERPTRGTGVSVFASLVNAVTSARERGVAVVWLTEELREFSDPGLRPTLRGRMSGSQLLLKQEDPA